ncbi:MAG: hypothetical protein WD607_01915 [Candidatus Paceibacterota bacterium]
MIVSNINNRLINLYEVFSQSGLLMYLVLISLYFPIQAQTTAPGSPYRYSVAYFGNNLWNPGLKVGMEVAWKVKTNVVKPEAEGHFNRFSDENGQGPSRTGTDMPVSMNGLPADHVQSRKHHIKKEWVPGASIGLYLDPGSHAGLFTNAGIGYRRTNANGNTRFASLHPAGMYRSFLTETYRYNEQEGVERLPLPGNLYYAPAFSLGIGKFTGPALQSGWFTQLTVITLVPYNHWIMPLINLEVGIMFGKRGGAK